MLAALDLVDDDSDLPFDEADDGDDFEESDFVSEDLVSEDLVSDLVSDLDSDFDPASALATVDADRALSRESLR